ncbi:MAG: glycosyltransferase family 2 protein [Xenococcaceae cyanobacterium MO_188.B32]|nr:glycosyltransferase family 2 protein [Xenococcaceae cyanobacterium MO_188.B32]
MNREVEVSVIIPAYNTEQYIHQAIASLLSQTLENIEIIVVDDCSTDNTVRVVRSFDDPRLRLLLNPQNLGAGGARNRALRAARGKWVAVLDSDDWYAPERLSRLVEVAEQKNADFVADDLYLIEDSSSSPWGTMIRLKNCGKPGLIKSF